ncbi:unnamed protein product [Mytilus coruscus]|uniref:Uncharacterized protein n=1 Tax=Mytilus coruscus TaxID=42192 RepID=A0A6J8CGC8_MYTCO|nr:unnamed protein product [Mytilus coruscus]
MAKVDYARDIVASCTDRLKHRNKLIKIADTSDGGWNTARHFVKDEYNFDFSSLDNEYAQNFTHDYYEYEQDGTDIIVKGRLKENIQVWINIGAYDYIIDTIRDGYKIPFYSIPPSTYLYNNLSALHNSDFVHTAFQDLLHRGLIVPCDQRPFIVNPLTVSVQSNLKKRLILDLRAKLKMIAMFLFVVVSLLSISHVGSVANTAECYRSEEILDCRGGGIQYFSGEIDPSISRVLMNHIMKSEQIQNVRVKATCVFELSMSNKELCDTVEGKIIVKLKMIAMFLFVVVSLLSISHVGSVANTAECYRSEEILDCRGGGIQYFSGEIDPSISRVLMNHFMKSEQIQNVRVKATCVFELSMSNKELCDTVEGKIIVKLKMIAMFLFVVVSLLSISHVGSVANTAECYRSEEILDCRGGGIQYFSGEIDPSISRVLLNHIMKSEQIQNVRVKAACVFELSMSNKELCDTVEGKIIVKLKMIAMFLFVVVSLLSISHVGSVANTAECYRSEEILDCRGGGIQYFSGEIDPSISRVLMNHFMKSEQIQNVRVKATCVFERSMSNKELCDTVEGKIIVKLKMIAMFLFVVVSLLSINHVGSVANTAECYRSEEILDCRGGGIQYFSGEIDPSISRVLLNHIMKSEQIQNVRVKAACKDNKSFPLFIHVTSPLHTLIIEIEDDCHVFVCCCEFIINSHVGSVANTAECYRSEEILDCRGGGIQYFSGEIDPSISRVLMNHIMKSEQIQNVRVKATCVFELSMSNKELCDTVEGKIIVVNPL